MQKESEKSHGDDPSSKAKLLARPGDALQLVIARYAAQRAETVYHIVKEVESLPQSLHQTCGTDHLQFPVVVGVGSTGLAGTRVHGYPRTWGAQGRSSHRQVFFGAYG